MMPDMSPLPSPPMTRRPGRPPDPEKRGAILAAAQRVFVSDGYAASMDRIAEEAGVSKQTIYKHFDSKEQLFADIIRQRADMMMAPLAAATPDLPCRDVLKQLAVRFLELLTLGDYCRLLTTIVASRSQFPDLGSHFYQVGPGATQQRLAEYLVQQTAQGRLKLDDPALAAEHFFGLTLGKLHLRLVLGLGAPLSPEELDDRAERAVRIFLAAYGVD